MPPWASLPAACSCPPCSFWSLRIAMATACRPWRPRPPSRPGWTRSRPGDRFIVAPQSDGGPGFVEVLASRLGKKRRLRVSGPLDTMVEAEWVFDPGTATAYLECAQACGLALLGGPPTPETAMAAHSRGVGQLIAEALRAGATRIVVGLGGSACTDGGQGMIAELGGLDVRPQPTGQRRAHRRLRHRIPPAGAVGGGQGVRAAEGRGHGHRRGPGSPPRGVGAASSRRWPDAT